MIARLPEVRDVCTLTLKLPLKGLLTFRSRPVKIQGWFEMGIKITKELVKYVYLNTPDKEIVKRELEKLYEIIERNIKEMGSNRDLKLILKDFEMLSDIFDVLYIRNDFSSEEISHFSNREERLKSRFSVKKEYMKKKKNYNGIYIYA